MVGSTLLHAYESRHLYDIHRTTKIDEHIILHAGWVMVITNDCLLLAESFEPSNISAEPESLQCKLMHSNTRMCQGCRSSLCLNDGSIPVAPFDLVTTQD